MDKFINIFVDIDFENNGAITVSSLEHFCAVNKLDKCMIETWVTLFDNQHTGRITQDKFCEVLGLAPEQIEEARSRRSSLASTGQMTPKDAPSSRRTSAVVVERPDFQISWKIIEAAGIHYVDKTIPVAPLHHQSFSLLLLAIKHVRIRCHREELIS
ncbi:hypothetical protein CRM22_003717 [Opisthorchis felineus]|uniref:EF-hand domain-containing protein n=1 Tax=Opisthorchis felineus TaxID=147828 RepID=A0A4S2M622_OPIFE|nr:hypothetical protein CRM22_003717 [Opisthorchis felineus]